MLLHIDMLSVSADRESNPREMLILGNVHGRSRANKAQTKSPIKIHAFTSAWTNMHIPSQFCACSARDAHTYDDNSWHWIGSEMVLIFLYLNFAFRSLSHPSQKKQIGWARRHLQLAKRQWNNKLIKYKENQVVNVVEMGISYWNK